MNPGLRMLTKAVSYLLHALYENIALCDSMLDLENPEHLAIYKKNQAILNALIDAKVISCEPK